MFVFFFAVGMSIYQMLFQRNVCVRVCVSVLTEVFIVRDLDILERETEKKVVLVIVFVEVERKFVWWSLIKLLLELDLIENLENKDVVFSINK